MTDPFDLSSSGAPAARASASPDPFAGSADPIRTASDPFAGSPGSFGEPLSGAQDGLDVAHAPLLLLGLASLVAVAAGFLAFLLAGDGPATLLPWLLAGPVAMSVLSAFTLLDTRARARPVYASGPFDRALYALAVVFITAAVAVSAVQIAFWFGRS